MDRPIKRRDTDAKTHLKRPRKRSRKEHNRERKIEREKRKRRFFSFGATFFPVINDLCQLRTITNPSVKMLEKS